MFKFVLLTELAKSGKVYATATEDMDALTFKTPKLLRKLTFSSGQKQPILEIDVNKVLSGLDLTCNKIELFNKKMNQIILFCFII